MRPPHHAAYARFVRRHATLAFKIMSARDPHRRFALSVNLRSRLRPTVIVPVLEELLAAVEPGWQPEVVLACMKSFAGDDETLMNDDLKAVSRELLPAAPSERSLDSTPTIRVPFAKPLTFLPVTQTDYLHPVREMRSHIRFDDPALQSIWNAVEP